MHIESPLSVVIMAAGKGTRMKSEKVKVLHEIFFLPMIHHVIKAVIPLQADRTIMVVGHQQEKVKNGLKNFRLSYAVQKQQLGTGHAVLAAENSIPDDDGTVLILCGDTPLLKSEDLVDMVARHSASGSALTIITTLLEDPTNYGRILSDEKGRVICIMEQKDASLDQQKIKEINAGIYCVNRKFLFQALKKVGTENSQGEVYLTDIVSLAVADGLKVEKYTVSSPLDVLGVNSRIELTQAHLELAKRRNRELMLEGITIYSPETTLISYESSVGMDSTLSGGVEITGNTQLGKSCIIGQGAIINNCKIGNHVTIGPYCCLTDMVIPANTIIASPCTIKIENTE